MAILSSTGVSGFLSSAKATGKQILNKAGKLIPEFESTFASGISGWIIRDSGDAEFKSIYIRDKFVTNEFVYNRIRVTEDEEILSSSIKIISSIDNGNGTYTVYPDLREGDINPLSNDDLLVGYYHNPANSGVIYAIQKFLALDDPNSENQSIILEPEGDSIPYQHMIIVRVGNVHDTDRQSFIKISSRTNCQYFYDGINSWEAYDDPAYVKCVLGKADIGLIPAWAVSVIGSIKRWFGLIADGVILRGTFVLQSSNKTVETELEGVNTTITDLETRFEVKEGQIAVSVKQAEKYATSASNNASFADEAANASMGILNTVKEREASINITAQGIKSRVEEIETQVDAVTGILQDISEKETSINQTAEGISAKVSEVKVYSDLAAMSASSAADSAVTSELAKSVSVEKASEAKQIADGFQTTVTETTQKAVDAAVTGADAMIEEKVSTQVTQSAREWKVEVMGADADGNPNQILAAINVSEEDIKIKGDKIEIDGTLIAQAIIATGLNINDKFQVFGDGTTLINGAIRTPFKSGEFIFAANGNIVASTPGLQNNNNVVITGGDTSMISSFEVPFTMEYDGFEATIINDDFNNEKAVGFIGASAPAGYSFYEYGKPINELKLYPKEGVRMIGISDGVNFKGWVVLQRFSTVGTNGSYNFGFNVMYAGYVDIGTIKKYKSCNDRRIVAERLSVGRYRLTFSRKFDSADYYMVFLTGVSSDSTGRYASVYEKNDSSFCVYTGDDDTPNDSGFTFMVINTRDWGNNG